jgi:hypothetical protein
MQEKTKEKIRYWMLFALDLVILLWIATMAVIFAINLADFKMNVIHPDICSCDGYDVSKNPVGDIYMYIAMNKAMDQCLVDCPIMRDNERSLTIGMESITIFCLIFLGYEWIKGRLAKWLKKKRIKF